MLQQLEIENFQSIRQTTVEPGKFTVILGGSDVGKSALIRAVQYAITNQVGQDFIRDGATETEVSLTFLEDGRDNPFGGVVTWTKGKSASYACQDDISVDHFDKARGVPPQVQQWLRLGPIVCGDIEVQPNYHSQFSHPFLIDETPSYRAKVLGELSGINLLYLATQEARRREGTARKEAGFRVSELEKQGDQLREYDDVELSGKALDTVHTLWAEALDLQLQVDTLSPTIHAIRYRAEQVLRLRRQLAAADTLRAAYGAVSLPSDDLRGLSQRITAIPKAANEIVRLQVERKAVQSQITELDAALAKVEFCPTCGQLMEN